MLPRDTFQVKKQLYFLDMHRIVGLHPSLSTVFLCFTLQPPLEGCFWIFCSIVIGFIPVHMHGFLSCHCTLQCCFSQVLLFSIQRHQYQAVNTWRTTAVVGLPVKLAASCWQIHHSGQLACHVLATKGLFQDLGGIVMVAEQPVSAHSLLGVDVYDQEPPAKRLPLWPHITELQAYREAAFHWKCHFPDTSLSTQRHRQNVFTRLPSLATNCLVSSLCSPLWPFEPFSCSDCCNSGQHRGELLSCLYYGCEACGSDIRMVMMAVLASGGCIQDYLEHSSKPPHLTCMNQGKP